MWKLTENPRNTLVRQLAIALVLMMGIWSCNDPELVMTTTDDVNITGYLEREEESYSDYLAILEKTGNSSFLSAYGTYTAFVPNNEAIQVYLEEKGKSSIDEIDIDELKTLVRFHLIEDTITTPSFTDGKIKTSTMHGQFLTTGAANQDGVTYVRVNKQANIIKSNEIVGNGIIHVIDRVLQPATQTLAQMIEANPEYSLFSQGLKETGFYDTLNVPASSATDSSRQWFSVFVQTDESFASEGITSFTDLKAKYSHTGNPKDPSDSLFLFMAYHILPDIKYVADIVTAPSHETLAPLEVITTQVSGTQVLINAEVVNGVEDPGSAIVREKSDFSATNGVLHVAQDTYRIKIRLPVPIYWDVADQPELRRMVADFRRPGKSVPITKGALKDVTWASENTIDYITVGAASADQFVYGDYLRLYIRPAVVPWVEFKTPLLVKGRYRVWINYRRTNYNDMQAFFNGEPLPRLFGLNPGPNYPSELTPREAEAQGWKLYTAGKDSRWLGRMIGTIDVKTTDRHTFRILGLSNRGGSTGNPFMLDMIHFIPIERDQILPRFERDGTPVYEE